ncbi:hypothetical protein [Erwinia sp. S38]|uniref:hypothetical protein n=1 Tax=Erwinia sp. S38 TaxID=2769338 RepID=UPI00190E4436|nr:hypothetical protein [Erwinia sp. S38]MBK0002526.1 hypothetical protein [Erwinia sp. S38]
MKKLSQVINERLANSNSSEYVTISYRPSHKIAAMIDVMCDIYGQNKANLFYDKIGELLSEYLLTSKESIPLIKKTAEEYSEDELSRSCIGALMERGTLSIDWPQDEKIRQQIVDALKG